MADEQSTVKALKEAIQAARESVEAKLRQQAEQKMIDDAQNGSQEVEDAQITMMVVTWDGDGIGNAVARAERSDDLAQMKDISEKIKAAQTAVVNWIQQNNGQVTQEGGDEGMCQLSSALIPNLEEMRGIYLAACGHTCTVGVGEKMSQAVNARELAKLTGKDQVKIWDESTDKELELRMDATEDEAKKVKDAIQPMKKSEVLEKMPKIFEADAKTPYKEVWRMQNEKGVGPYMGLDHEEWSDDSSENSNRHPSPADDSGFDKPDLKTLGTKHKYGFESKEHLDSWFSPDEQSKLSESGFKPTKVKAKRIWSSGKQAFYEPHEEVATPKSTKWRPKK